MSKPKILGVKFLLASNKRKKNFNYGPKQTNSTNYFSP